MLCDNEIENSWHSFFTCPTSVIIWKQSGMWSGIEATMTSADGFKRLVFMLLSSLNEGKIELLLMK